MLLKKGSVVQCKLAYVARDDPKIYVGSGIYGLVTELFFPDYFTERFKTKILFGETVIENHWANAPHFDSYWIVRT